jgi:RNA polymerase sigma-70 factor, ECF subfamily
VSATDRNTNEIEEVYRQHGPALLLFASAMSGDQSRAQDAIHQVFLKLLANGNLSRAVNKKAYLFKCVRNEMLNEANVQNRNTAFDTDSFWFNPPDRDYAGEQNLRRALIALPNEQREVIVLHIWGDLTFSEIGKLLDVSSNTVASRHRYAVAKLRELMSAKGGSCAKSG